MLTTTRTSRLEHQVLTLLVAGHAAHMDHLTWLLQAGHALVSGPLLGAGDLRGLTIFRTDSLAAAQALAAADPAVRAGRFVVEIYPWWVPAGVLLGG